MRLTRPAAARRAVRRSAGIAAAVAGLPALALAHPGQPLQPHDLWWTREAWPLEWPVVAGIVVTGWLYARGVRRVWARAGRGRGVAPWRAAAFAAGLLATAAALLTPLAAAGGALFSAHMLQHVVLMLIAAPLLVLGAASHAIPWALPLAARRRIGTVVRVPALRRGWRALTNPVAAWTIHAVAVLAWHVPALFELTLRSEAAHVAQHASFFGTALLFWAPLARRGAAPRLPAGAGVLYLFTTGVYGAAIGAYLTLADGLLYPAYADRVAPWGLTPLEDQQLGGLLMWVPSGLVYVGAGLAVLAVWLREAERAARGAAWRTTPAAGARPLPALLATVALGGALASLGGCDSARPVHEAALAVGGDPARAPAVIRRHGCASCHVIPDVAGARGRVGPSLAGVAGRRTIAGRLPNSPETLVRFIVNPRHADPNTLMPVTGITEAEARDVVAWLLARP